ncbi:unnamed protein product [Larinioides sclopetarius]|uniref:Uncharacterized protein n=1 Tax=Larinioides sclopetarius TaxID=280406 RepID=A0AAV2BTN8_9ARAC
MHNIHFGNHWSSKGSHSFPWVVHWHFERFWFGTELHKRRRSF